jgi:ATP-dependent Clp protease ATP-binding subunit ClpA
LGSPYRLHQTCCRISCRNEFRLVRPSRPSSPLPSCSESAINASFAQSLEKTLHAALSQASERSHEYATLEHLLLALIDDPDASQVMIACGVDLGDLAEAVKQYLDQEYQSLKTKEKGDPAPTAGFQRVIQRAILHVQSSGKDTVTGANVLVALFSERDSYAVYFLQQQDMSRLDAVSFISHGSARAARRSRTRAPRAPKPKNRVRKKSGNQVVQQCQQEGFGARPVLRQSQ